MAKYKHLKQERDEALERAVFAERNSQLETLERERREHEQVVTELRRVHEEERAALQARINALLLTATAATSLLNQALGSSVNGQEQA